MATYRTLYIHIDNECEPIPFDSVPMACDYLGYAERTVRRHFAKGDTYKTELGTLHRVEMEQVSREGSGKAAFGGQNRGF